MELRHNSTLLFLTLPLFLRLNRDLEAPLQSENLLTPLLLGLLFFLPPLIQRAKQRVCWRSFNMVQSKQDWQVRLKMQEVILKQEVRIQTTEEQHWHFFFCISSCRFGGSAAAAGSNWSYSRGWSVICQCLGSQSVNPLLCPSLLLLSGPS